MTAKSIHTDDHDDRIDDAIGAAIRRVLMLKQTREHPDRVDTSGGTKTDRGLARTIRSIFETLEGRES